MAKDKTTIYDIAKTLQVTPSTVSRALKDHPRISAKTKKAVKEMASQLNYQHNNVAAALRSGNTFILGIVLPKVNRTFFSSVIKGVEQLVSQANYRVMITQSHDNFKTEQANIQALINAQVDGIIASIAKETTSYEHYQRVIDQQIPLILFDRVMEISNASTVVIDDFLGAYEAVSHLIEQGCRRIVHFTGVQSLNIYKYRLRGYREALEDHGIAFDPALVIESDMQLEDGKQVMQQLLDDGVDLDAIFASSDHSAMGAMQVLKAQKIRIPEEIAIVGFADEPFTAFVEPGLSSVNQKSEMMGQIAAKIFLEQVQFSGGEYTPTKTVLKPELIIRASSLKRQ